MTKAAVKNMLRLMEDFDPGRDDSAVELDQYALFILQQREITVAGREIQQREIPISGREGNVPNSGDNSNNNSSSSFNARSDDNTSLTTRNQDNDNGNRIFNMKSAPGAVTTTSEAGPNHAPSAAGACVSVVGVSPEPTAVASIATTREPNATAVNLAMVPGNDAPENPPSTPLQPVADGTAGGTNIVSNSGTEGEIADECYPRCTEFNNKNDTGGYLGGVNASGAAGSEGDTGRCSARGSDASGVAGGMEEAVVAGPKGQQQPHSSTRNNPSILSTVTKEGSLVETVASNLMVAGKGGNPAGEALDAHSSPELKVRRRKMRLS